MTAAITQNNMSLQYPSIVCFPTAIGFENKIGAFGRVYGRDTSNPGSKHAVKS
jgi:hypothetical protein